MSNLLYENGPNGLWTFGVLTIVLGGAAAASTGRALAKSWQPFWRAIPYMACLAAFVRFLHYALFGAVFLSFPHYAVDLLIDTAFAGIGFYSTRRRQMLLQYGWMRDDATS